MNEQVEIYDMVSGTVVTSGSVVSLINDGYKIEWDNLADEWCMITYHPDLDDGIEEFLGTSNYMLALREA